MIDPSVTAAGMGGASGAVFWEKSSGWANPALVGMQRGVCYAWSEANLTGKVPSDEHLRARRLMLGYSGIGVCFGGEPVDGLGGTRLDGRLLIGYDDDLNLIGYFSYAESVTTVTAGISLVEAAENIAGATRVRVPRLSRYGDIALGWGSKRISSGYFPRHVTLHDVGGLLRVTPYNSIETSGMLPSLDRVVALRLDLAFARSTQNKGTGTLFSWDHLSVQPIPELSRRSWATRAVVALPREKEHSLRNGAFGWLLAFVSPSVSFGASWDRIHPTRRDLVTHDRSTGPPVRRSGWELSFANLISLRRGSVDDRDAAIVGKTSGLSIGIDCRGIGGFRFDRAHVPGRGERERVRQEGFVVYMDPVRAWRGVW